MAPKTRWMILLTLLIFSAGLVLFGGKPGAEEKNSIVSPAVVSKATERSHERGNHDRAVEMSDRTSLQTDTSTERQQEILAIHPRTSSNNRNESTDAFVARNWNPPPPQVFPSPPPSAPPLPFSFLGKKFENGKWTVFLGLKDDTYIVKEQDILNQHYSIDAIDPPTMTITYIPLKQQQTLAIGDAQ